LPGEVRQSLLDMEQTFGLLDRKSSLSNGGKLLYDPSVMGTNITLQNVKFSYPGRTDHPILNGIDLDIAGGKTVALVGSSGCGKSTILRLLYRFYDPTNDDGIITVGSHKTLDLNLESLRRNIAVVPQDTVLFHDSIFYNLSYGNFNRPPEDVIEAAKKAKIHDTIMSFPDGYDTVVGERGLKLSGGEKQRVAIARAILKDADIILFDEPTSSLDSMTETDIMNNIKKLGKNCTTIIVAHRLSTIQDCDEIIVLHDGKVVERGTHKQLLGNNGRYNELLKLQNM